MRPFELALRYATVRLGICADRMRGCNAHHEEGGRKAPHELLEEVEAWEKAGREALGAGPDDSLLMPTPEQRHEGQVYQARMELLQAVEHYFKDRHDRTRWAAVIRAQERLAAVKQGGSTR